MDSKIKILTETVLQIIDYILYRDNTNLSKEHLNKTYNYNIEYIEDIDITIIPKVLYILTDEIKDDYNKTVLELYINILYNIHKEYNNNIKINSIEHNNMGTVKSNNDERIVSIIRGNTITLSDDNDYEIWIYTDKNKQDKNEQFVNSLESTSHMVTCRIIIAHSNKLSKTLDNMSIILYL